ncbi:hypothetical protein GCM10022231_05690 [Gordonia caeni]|uniref:Secreted protein n=1 Tax=Gordonia caeni TaxID=1007097 RepID=A0ABP7NP47_9ACTN
MLNFCAKWVKIRRMDLNLSKRSIALRVSAVVFAGAALSTLSGFGAGSAHAAPGGNLPNDCRQFSQDGGTTWGSQNVVTWSADRPVPGGEVTHARFLVKNVCEEPAKLQVFLGNWSISGNGSANVRANAGAAKSVVVPMNGTPGKLVVETGRLTQNTPVAVELFIGIPASETRQGFTITPDWGIALEEVSGDAPVDPGDPDPGNPGNPGDGDGSSAGSLDLFGSLGGATGSLDSLLAAQTLQAPAVQAAGR